MSDLFVSWSEYHQKIEQLAAQIYQSGWEFNQIVCIAKGGLRVGDILCRLYRKPLAILSASSYTGADYQTRGQIQFSRHLSMTTEGLSFPILLVDDLVDSGISLQESITWLKHYQEQEQEGDRPNEIRTAVLWYKSCSVFAPDYYMDYLTDNPWIHQPFEVYEQTPLEELVAKYQ
ncbi:MULTISPECIES: phosphoribosyltransferase [unclassified Roseofilum]|uniref:phosphoribosyltransferase n=1 Tax=unclassified Roseofilum TaxID=2620099 RepID=UPI000E825DDC|nr:MULTISPECIES: phosphoribosyltransferase [unclassified Roseofilum]MBP0010892.1 phosphoribosyltransferase [Roseofilum sp. Belize Diploria]MBP0035280.1 phosphoribosyltransferase [Roseofilum sp. Belize BBD 4]MBP0040667.1 phosphoribosyltransferase [Roseofilum sp. SBFL]HBQ97508.1 phosphoribosyltransferase [Cyanobacteria bacterium UBA11691]